MEKTIYALIIVFVIISITLILQSLGIFKKFDKKLSNPYKSKNPPKSTAEHLTILNGNFDASIKSNAIMSLIEDDSYFYVQVQGNAGNNYDDKIQTTKFSQLLSPSAITDLKKLEGKNGQYSF